MDSEVKLPVLPAPKYLARLSSDGEWAELVPSSDWSAAMWSNGTESVYSEDQMRAYAQAALAPQARPNGGEAVAWRFLRDMGGGVHAWTRWLGMDELHHYGKDGDLVNGPHPDWRVEYAYTHPAPDDVARLVGALRGLMLAYEGRMGDWENAEFSAEYNEAVAALAPFTTQRPAP